MAGACLAVVLIEYLGFGDAMAAKTRRHGIHFSSGLKHYKVEARVGEYQVDALADTGA
jgi:predicted aspartyl protease